MLRVGVKTKKAKEKIKSQRMPKKAKKSQKNTKHAKQKWHKSPNEQRTVLIIYSIDHFF